MVMGATTDQDDVIGPWSEDKLQLLKKYLEAYTTIMKEQKKKWCKGYHYIDAFAGTGKPRAQDEERYIDGSPRVALSIRWPFDSYTFIEKEPRRVQRLHELEREFPERVIEICPGDCNQIIIDTIVPRITYEKRNRGFVFLDPFGMDLEWTTVERIAETRALEVLINFPAMAINRTALPNNPYKLTEDKIELNNRFWGPGWRDDIYEETPTLFGSWEIKIQPTSAARLSQLYRDRLGQVFPYVTEPLVMRNSRDVPLYCLIFAGHNQTGADITTSVFRRYERLGR
jgi:three-Cys-motif partner protein